MSANLVANVTFNGTLTVQGPFSNVQYMNAATSNLFTFTTGKTIVPAIKVAADFYHTAVLLTNGTVLTFGNNGLGQLGVNDTTNRSTPVQVWGISSSATAVACGRRHTAVLLADGTVRTFGHNLYGQLGVGDGTQRNTPVTVLNITSAIAISARFYSTAILLANGTVWTFGGNFNGCLGVNDTVTRQTPVQVWGISSSAIAITTGTAHMAVLLADGTVRAFGRNSEGVLGVNDNTSRQTPVQVWGISSSAVAVACGQYHMAILLANGTVRTVGSNTSGQLGVNDTATRSTPVPVWGISSSATGVACGWGHVSVLLADGTVRTFGRNDQGQLGVNDIVTRQTPVQVLNITSATAVAGGRYHTATILADGTVRTFGGNASGQLGVNDTTSRLTPVQVVSGYSATAQGTVAGGFYSTAILMADGTVRTFGKNNRGQLGLGDTTSRLTPVQISGITSANAVGCGNYFSAILLNNGTVRSFGRNISGQLGVNDTTDRYTPVQVWGISSSATAIACGGYQVGVLLADKTVRMFGSNSNGQLGVGDTTSRLTPVQVLNITSAAAIASGTFFTLVVLADGTVRSFGANSNGQLGLNDTTSRLTPVQVWGISSSATAVACGGDHAAILLTDGTVRTFGYNGDGRLGLNDTVNRLTPVQVFGISSSAVAVACGYNYTAVLLANGTVRTFGENVYGGLGVGDLATRLTPVQVWGISSSAIAIACGTRHTVVFLSDGTGRTFGSNNSGELGVADAVDRRIPVKVGVSGNKVAGGSGHTAVVSNDGTVRMFGLNSNGQLGVNDLTNRLTPVQITGLTSAIAVGNGQNHTAVLLADGTIRTFGRNNSGQLGVNDTIDRSTPVQVWGISSSAVAVACGQFYTAVLLADGTVRMFGLNATGQLGVGDVVSRQTPVQVLNISTATAVACGSDHTAVLLADGTVRTFGRNSEGELGVNDSTSRLTPVTVLNITSATAVVCGLIHTAVLLTDKTVQTFGYNSSGQLGIGNFTQKNTPVQVLNITSASGVAAGRYITSVLLADGTVQTFGNNAYGQLGVNDTTNRNTPVPVLNITSASAMMSGGYYHAAILLQDGTVRTFGRNQYGELGVNDTTSRLTPVQVITSPLVTALGKVARGIYHTAVLLTDGTVRTFGYNFNGQLGINDTNIRSTPVQVWGISSSAVYLACGTKHTAVILRDGTARTFGYNLYGQLGNNDANQRSTPVQVWGISSSATAVAIGDNHTAILLSDGTVRTFGFNASGQLGNNDTGVANSRVTPVQVWGISSSATAIACGGNHTIVLLADGTVRTFGQNTNGQLGVNDTVSRQTPVQVLNITSATAVAGGLFHTAILLADGTIRTFGNNGYGQIGVNDTTNRLTPVQVWGISSSATAVACGLYDTAVLITDGTVRTFGRNDAGGLGIGDTTSRLTPVTVLNITTVTALATGGSRIHNAVLLSNGTVRTFGDNSQGQLGVNDTTQRNTPVQVLNITTAVSPSPLTYITNATAIVVPLSSAAPLTAVYLTSAAQSLNSAFVFNGPVFTSNIGLGRVPDINYQLDMSTDGARKTFSSTWTTGSDIRIKSDVVTANLARCAEIVDSLDLKYFKWNFPEGQTPPPDGHSLGWIAQDVQQFFPKSVETSGDFGLGDFHSLNSDQLVKVLWGALKHTLNEHFPNQQ